MRQLNITFPCGDILLEGVWHFPEVTGPVPAVIACHPHSLYGGSMSNSVVFNVCEALARQSIAALRFNFRGVGASGGTYGGGIEEQEDVRAALALVSSTDGIDRERVGLVGYSFGAGVALPVAVYSEAVKLLALVSPALSDDGRQQLEGYSRPVFIIVGGEDSITPAEPFQQWAGDFSEPKRCVVIPGADHFWWGYEAEVAEEVARFFLSRL